MANRKCTDCELPFRNVLFVVSCSEKRLRNWLDRGPVQLDANKYRGKEKHRRFSTRDCVRLGMIYRLMPYGFTAKDASELVEVFLQRALPKPGSHAEMLKALRGLQMTFLVDNIGRRRLFLPRDLRKRTSLKPLPSHFVNPLTLLVGPMVADLHSRLLFLWEKGRGESIG